MWQRFRPRLACLGVPDTRGAIGGSRRNAASIRTITDHVDPSAMLQGNANREPEAALRQHGVKPRRGDAVGWILSQHARQVRQACADFFFPQQIVGALQFQ